MKRGIKLFLVIVFASHPCDGVSLRRQLQHIIDSRLQSSNHGYLPSRRFYQYDPREVSSILGVPSRPSHLPEAEPILPGHTLLRPALGMLKSSVKFPHKDLEDGSGVYGNIDSLGLRYDARNERLHYSGFRRSPSDYIMVVPSKEVYYGSPRFKLMPAVLDLEQKEKTKNDLLKILKRLNIVKGAKIYIATLGGNNKAKLHSHVLRASASAQKGSMEKENESISNEQPANSERPGKMKWLLDSKNIYNNIKVNQNAPELNELMPKGYQGDNIREWWYYNANDYTPFDD